MNETFCWLDVYTTFPTSCMMLAAVSQQHQMVILLDQDSIQVSKKKKLTRYFPPVFEKINFIGNDVSLTHNELEDYVRLACQPISQ